MKNKMINRTLLFLIALMPSVCWGLDDACNAPEKFTYDKRCYVTEEQKKIFPYNTVVGLQDSEEDIYCTGTIIRKNDDAQFKVYTAKHCTDNDEDHVPDTTITVKTQNGNVYKATNESIPTGAYGNYNLAEGNLYSGDWAQYDIIDAPDNLLATNFTTRHSGFRGEIEAAAENSSAIGKVVAPIKAIFQDNNFNVQVVGYGALKIMSDEDIQNFKDKYNKFLEENLETTVKKIYEGLPEEEMQEKIDVHKKYSNGYTFGGSISVYHPIVMAFLAYNMDEMLSIFNDENLKVSFCQLNSDGYQQGCQTWGGNSGGPIFDKDGKLMGIVTHANYIIGGVGHASRKFLSQKYNDGGDNEIPDGRPDSNIHFLK